MVTNMTTYPINSMVLGKVPSADDRQTFGVGRGQDPCPTLQCKHHHCVAIIYEEEDNVPEPKRPGGPPHLHGGGWVSPRVLRRSRG